MFLNSSSMIREYTPKISLFFSNVSYGINADVSLLYKDSPIHIASKIVGSGSGGREGIAGKNGSDAGASSSSSDSNQNTNSPNYNNNKKGVTLAIADNFGMNNSEDDNNNDKNDNKNDDNLNDKKPGTKGQNLVTDAIANTITNGGK